MAVDFKSESEVKEYLKNLGIEYRFGCYSEKNPEVCHLLGDYLEAIKKDFKKAGKVYKTNCDEHNYAKSCLKYGTFALLGKGDKKPDYKEAYGYFEKACSLDHADACFNQGIMLIANNETSGIKENPKKGMELLEKACNGKNSNACYYLSGMYISGVKKKFGENKPDENLKKPEEKFQKPEYIVAKDMAKAFKFAMDGCTLGNMYCCANLSQMFKKGEGVEKSQEMADKYKKIALEMQNEVTDNKTLTFQEGLKT